MQILFLQLLRSLFHENMAWDFGFLAPNMCKQLSRNGTFSPGLDVLEKLSIIDGNS